MFRWLYTSFQRLFGFFHEETIVEPVAEQKKDKKKIYYERNQWYTLGNILDVLDKYHEHIKAFKKTDRESYDLYSKIGGVIVPEKTFWTSTKLTASFLAGNRPSFGCIHFKDEEDDECKDKHGEKYLTPVFMYFQKFSKIWLVQPSKNDIYQVSMFYKAPEKSYGGSGTFYVAVDEKGNITPLKERKIVTQVIKQKTASRKKGKGETVIKHSVYSFPEYFQAAKERYKEQNKQVPTEEQIASDVFACVMTAYEHANSGLQVRCEKNGINSVFYVDMLRTPYFFKDREKTVNVNGKTKKIFHIVRVHERNKKDGTISYVKTHFRGERNFVWNGYNVTISMQGLHHKDITSFDVKAIAIDEQKKNEKGFVGMKEIGNFLDQHMSQ